MRGKNKKRHRVQKLKQGSSEVAGVADFGEREKNATSTAAATLTVPSVENKNVQCPDTIDVYTSTPTNQAHVAADGSAIIVRVKEFGNQAAIVSVLAIASPLKPPHDLALTKFACPLYFSSQALLYRCKLDITAHEPPENGAQHLLHRFYDCQRNYVSSQLVCRVRQLQLALFPLALRSGILSTVNSL